MLCVCQVAWSFNTLRFIGLTIMFEQKETMFGKLGLPETQTIYQ